MLGKEQGDRQDVTAIITAMTDGEKPFLRDATAAVLADPCIGQVIICVAEQNNWLDSSLGDLAHDPRLEILKMPLMPPGMVRNRAIDQVKHAWIAFCDGDDIWCEGKTAIQLDYAIETGSDLVGADHYLTDEHGKILAFALGRFISMPSSWLVRTEVMQEHRFNGSLKTGSDGEWWCRTDGAIRKSRCPQMLLKYRVRLGSVSSVTPSKRRKAQIVYWASMPVFNLAVLSISWGLWQLTRQKKYLWHKSWGSQSS
ncbi:glycosyl transferase family 2 [Thalassoporum mexicanum PCC 7367]|nr:glycosyl transferase family 2 [Pseudanabaena sp. PCC 7367]